jgi:Glycosyl transferase family 90
LDEENAIGISLDPIMDFLFTSSVDNVIRIKDKPLDANSSGPMYRPTLYMIEPGGSLWTSQWHRRIQQKPKAKRRFINTERSMLKALNIIQEEYQTNQSCSDSQWPTLCKTIFPSGSTGGGNGVPFLAYYGDYDSCNRYNWVSSSGEDVSVPLFTTAARLDCNYTVPFPNYYSQLMSSGSEWDRLFELYRERYAWDSKTPVVAWRGGMTGIIRNATEKCPRWKMVQTVREIESKRGLSLRTSKKHTLFDVAITHLPPPARPFAQKIEVDVGKINSKEDSMDFIDFQKYRAILDIDGNSWSGRFGSLLCLNSVILKVEPAFMEYFYYGYKNPHMKGTFINDSLQPWKHFIPVKADFSDLEELAEFVLDPKNDEEILQIVQNANDWCRQKMIDESFAIDMLNIWERYVQLLYVNDPSWNLVTWNLGKARIVDSSSPFELVLLSPEDYSTREAVIKMEPRTDQRHRKT